MKAFGKTSLVRLSSCTKYLEQVCMEAVERCPYTDPITGLTVPDLIIICGHRTEAEQQAAFDNYMSKVQWPNSRHNTFPSEAVDIGPYIADLPGHIPWSNKAIWKAQHNLIMTVANELHIPLRSGIDWDRDGVLVDDDPDESFWDAPHYEEI